MEEEEEEEEEEVEVALRRKEAMPVPQRRTWETSLKSNNKFSVLANSEKVLKKTTRAPSGPGLVVNALFALLADSSMSFHPVHYCTMCFYSIG